MIKVYIGIPVHRTMEVFFQNCLTDLISYERERGVIDLKIEFLPGESLISRGRNTIAHRFLKSDCDYLFMIDSDMTFPKDGLEQLLLHDLELVGANYMLKNLNGSFAGKPDSYVDDLSPATFIPTGFMLIKRSMFDKLEKVDVYNHTGMEGVKGFFIPFVTEVEGVNRYLSEDWAFSYRCRDAGIVGFIDNTIRLGHIGFTIYMPPERPQ